MLHVQMSLYSLLSYYTFYSTGRIQSCEDISPCQIKKVIYYANNSIPLH